MTAVKLSPIVSSKGVAMPKMTQRKHTATHSTHEPRTLAGGLLAQWRAWTPSATAVRWLTFTAGIFGAIAVFSFPWFLVLLIFWQAPVRGLLFVASWIAAGVLFSKAENAPEEEEEE